MNESGVVLLAIPYELLPVVIRALENEAGWNDRTHAERAWCRQRADILRTESDVWQEHQEALANLLKSQEKS